MRNDRRKQIMTLSILVVGVLVLSIGFAAFSSILNISSTATYTPGSDVFKIKFSKSSNSIIDGTNNLINPVSGNGGSATITNDGTPKISKLQANFTSPGQSVVYEFYAVNETPYDAYLTTINYLNITGKTITKECTGSNGATPSLVSKACEGINVLVEVGTTTANKTTTVNNHTLGKNSSEKVKVTIEYTGQAIDGSMTVTFGDISLIYSTAQGGSQEQPGGSETPYTGSIYRNSEEHLYLGDNIDANRWCIVVPGSVRLCGDPTMIFDSKTKCETELEKIVNDPFGYGFDTMVPDATCEVGTLSYETNLANINTNTYLKHDVVDNKVTASYGCITYTEDGTRKDVCIRGADLTYFESNQHESNISILRSAESYFTNDRGYCYFEDLESYCISDSLELRADSSGYVYAGGGGSACIVNVEGTSTCSRE